MVRVNNSFTDPKTKLLQPSFDINWQAYAAARRAKTSAFACGRDETELLDFLSVIRSETSRPNASRVAIEAQAEAQQRG